MDYEKKYNDALNLAKSYYGKGCNDFLDTIFPELRESEDERVRKEINTLYTDIDTCISELLKARTDKDSEAEGKALFKMEGLMVATLQDLSCIETYLEKNVERMPAEWSEEETKDLVHILKVLDDCYAYGKHDLSKTDHDNLTSTIKFLRPSWKPSEEQMQALGRCLDYLDESDNEDFEIMQEIYDNLKKLGVKEEPEYYQHFDPDC